MEPKTWASSPDGNIIYQQITKKHLQEALDLMQNSFFLHENVSTSMELYKSPEAIVELVKLAESAAEDGVSLVAIDTKNNRVAGALFNKLQVLDSNQESDFESYTKVFKEPKARDLVQFMIDFDQLCNLFDLCQTDCLMELMFLGVYPDYRGQGIGKQLFKTSLEICSLLKHGTNVKLPLESGCIDLKPIPGGVCSILTSSATHKIGEALNFSSAVKKYIGEFEYEGKNFESIVGDKVKYIDLGYKIL